MKYKCLSIYQPWASLIACGVKIIETRSWPTQYRGDLCVHAGKSLKWLHYRPFNDPLSEIWRKVISTQYMTEAPRGAIIAIVRLMDCIPTERAIPYLSTEQIAMGDYTPGRWAWCLDLVFTLPHPVPCRGMQRLFTVDGNVAAHVARQIPWRSV